MPSHDDVWRRHHGVVGARRHQRGPRFQDNGAVYAAQARLRRVRQRDLVAERAQHGRGHRDAGAAAGGTGG
ncbi:hypothetical protein G6F40_017652 [Rhizopus arrhizus]|nr:hypothetical protein G6F40_017652 [Rhizopus arrhizus]